MATSRRNNRALNRVLRDSLRARPRSEPPQEDPSAPRAAAYKLCADIPECYNDSYVRAIPKDPQNTFVYWELPKDQANSSLFADKGTAHVKNDEAVRIGQQLNENHRQRQADNRQNDYHHANTDYCQINWNDGNQYSFDGGNQQHYQNADNNYHQVNWDNGNHYNFDGGNQQHHPCADNYHQVNWDDGNFYCFDDGGRQQHHNQDNSHDVNWNNSDDYRRREEAYKYIRGRQDNIYQLNLNDGGNYAPYRHSDDGSAFSEMLAALIDRCKRYIADYSQSDVATLARAISSGLLRGVGEEPRT